MSRQDLLVQQDNYGTWDLVLNPETKDFEFVSGFETAINFQLFTNRRTNKQEVSVPQRRGGWLCDIRTKQGIGYEVGSFLYLKDQSRNTELDRNELAAYASSSFSRLLSVGAIKSVTANTVGNTIEGVIVGTRDEVTRYASLWRNTNAD